MSGPETTGDERLDEPDCRRRRSRKEDQQAESDAQLPLRAPQSPEARVLPGV